MAEKRKVMVIDDNYDDIGALHTALAKRGYDFCFIDKPEGLLGNVLALAPSVVIVKLEMPGMDGFAIAGEIHSHPRLKDLPVILTSERRTSIDAARASSCGIGEFAPKPLDIDTVCVLVARSLAKSREHVKKKAPSGPARVFLVHSHPSRGNHLLNMLDLKLRKGLLERHERYHVVTDRGNVVEEGKEALTAIKKVKPDILIISDYFEGMNGWQVCEALRKDKDVEAMQIVMLVSRKSKDVEWLKDLGGVSEILYEPFHSKDLVNLVRGMSRAEQAE
jgi:CheY-like chemotaxis protein